MLVGLAAFGINSSLLSFIPSSPQHGWRYVNQAVLMTLGSSTLVAVGALLLNAAFGGSLLGAHPWAVVIYVWLFTNFDFWEPLLIAEKQAYRVWGYTTGRLVCRLLVVTIAAALTKDVSVIVWSLVGYEALRMLLSARVWHSRNRAAGVGTGTGGSWREQLRYCAPFGSALIVSQLNASMGGLFVTKLLGPAALAQFAIGAYAQPIVTVLRNSLSDVLLGEMAARRLKGDDDLLTLWRRSTVVTAILLVPLGVVLARFADTIVTTLFSPAYQPAVIVFQVYVLALLRETFDFGIPLRALNRTAPILRTNLLAIVVNAALMAFMVPAWGLAGAAVALIISRIVEGTYLARELTRAFNLRLPDLARWSDLGKIVAAAAAAGAVLFLPLWSGLLGVLGGAAAFGLSYVLLLRLARIPEIIIGFNRAQHYSRALLTRLQT